MSEPLPPWARSALGAPLSWRDDFVAAARFLTRLPLGRFVAPATGLLARSMRAFPLVGALVGAIGWAAFEIAARLGLPGFLAALIAVLATVLATGGLHEDGLADTADGFGGGEDRARKLAIMRDSRSGAFAILAIAFSLALRGGALAALTPIVIGSIEPGPALIAAHVVSRAALPILMRVLEPARSDGLGASAGQPDVAAALWCLLLALLAAILCLGAAHGIIAILVTAAFLAGFAALARQQIGGYTGDVLGAAQQIGEIAMLLTAAA